MAINKVQLVLDSPYGFIIIDGKRVNNGCFIEPDRTINGEEVPLGWIKTVPVGRPDQKTKSIQVLLLTELMEGSSSPEELQAMMVAKLIELKELG